MGLDSRLRGNDKGVGSIQTYIGNFVATTFGYNQHVVVQKLLQHPRINLEIPKQVRNDMERRSIFMAMTRKRASGSEDDVSTFYSNDSTRNCLEEQGLIL
jgi:hypothetical protein